MRGPIPTPASDATRAAHRRIWTWGLCVAVLAVTAACIDGEPSEPVPNPPDNPGGGGGGGCQPKTCQQLGFDCGEVASDGCGGTLNCGTCVAPSTCGGGGKANVCGCMPRTQCTFEEGECGVAPNGCGGFISCGTCQEPEVCGARGQANTCGIPTADRYCTVDGWCWEYPLPHGNTIHGAHFRAADDGWAVGDEGHIQHWDGTKWSQIPSGTLAPLHGVQALAANDVWAVGDTGTVLRDQGNGFQKLDAGTPQNLASLWAASATDVWTVGAKGTVLRNQGSGFQKQDAGTAKDLQDVWGSGPSDVWMVGNSGTVLRHDGTALSTVTASTFDGGTSLNLYEVTGTGPQDVWTVTSDDPCFFCSDYGVVYQVTPQGISKSFEGPDQLFHIFAAGPNHVLTVGEDSRYLWDGSTWRETSVGRDGVLAGVGPEDVWLLGGAGLVQRWSGTSWTTKVPTRYVGQVRDIHGSSASNVWAVDTSGNVLFWNGGGWRELQADTFDYNSEGVYTVSPTATWVLFEGISSSDNVIYRWNGTAFAKELDGNANSLYGIHGSSETDVWVVGEAGTALHRTETGWTPQPTGAGANLNDVWASPGMAVAVGDSGTIMRWDGTAWTGMSSGTSSALRAVWGSGPTDIWAAGANGILLHFTGTTWLPAASGTTSTLNALWGTGPSDIWAAGAGGTLLHFNGTQWSRVSTGTRRALTAGWSSSTTDVWVGGDTAIFHKP